MKYPTHDATALLVGGKFTDGDPINAVPPSPDRADYQNAVYDELLAVIAAAGLTPNFADRTQVQTAIAAQIAASLTVTRTHRAPVRQTVLCGPTTSGAADFLTGVGDNGLELVTGVSTAPLRICFADGFDEYGERDLLVSIDDDEALTGWTLTEDNAPNYCYVQASTFATDATLTCAKSTLAPVYSTAAPGSPASGQYWFDIVGYKGYEWSGSTWQPVLRVYVGQATSSGSSVDNVISYAYQGRFYAVQSGDCSVGEENNFVINHNLGVTPLYLDATYKFVMDSAAPGNTIQTAYDSFASFGVSSNNEKQVTGYGIDELRMRVRHRGWNGQQANAIDSTTGNLYGAALGTGQWLITVKRNF